VIGLKPGFRFSATRIESNAQIVSSEKLMTFALYSTSQAPWRIGWGQLSGLDIDGSRGLDQGQTSCTIFFCHQCLHLTAYWL